MCSCVPSSEVAICRGSCWGFLRKATKQAVGTWLLLSKFAYKAMKLKTIFPFFFFDKEKTIFFLRFDLLKPDFFSCRGILQKEFRSRSR